MKCPNHPENEVTGYCGTCGAFGCAECLTQHEGLLLCARHYRPIAKKIEEERKLEKARKKQIRQRLVVRYQDGRTERGVSYALNTRDSSFYLDEVDENGVATGKTHSVRFSDLKAVFFVKSFDGNFDKRRRYSEWAPEGSEMWVEFKDGETIRGFSLRHYDPAEPRFHIIPSDPATNNISILVEAAAVHRVYTAEEYQAKRAQEEQERKVKREAGAPDLSQEETLGDFYFETRNYPAALEQYELAMKKQPKSGRIRRKTLAAQYNVGVQCIKRREYREALMYMERVLAIEPENPHAVKKVVQLRRIIEREQKKQEAALEDAQRFC